MRLTTSAINKIKQVIHQQIGYPASIRLFGSRLDPNKKGGDIDLLVSLKQPVENPALLMAQLTSQLRRAMLGRKVDVLITAPNLNQQTIHKAALAEGVIL